MMSEDFTVNSFSLESPSGELGLSPPLSYPPDTRGRSASVEASANLTSYYLSQLDMSSDYLKKRIKKKNEKSDKIRDLIASKQEILDQLNTAVESKMDKAVIAILDDILISFKKSSNRLDESINKEEPVGTELQRIYQKANISSLIKKILMELGGNDNVCVYTLSTIAYLCRFSDNENSYCLEISKSFGLDGICELLIGAIKRHYKNVHVLIAACDAMWGLSLIAANRIRLSNAGACEILSRALTTYNNHPEALSWIFRIIGHIASPITIPHISTIINDTEDETSLWNSINVGELFTNTGACEHIITTMQKFGSNLNVCTYACFAIRNLATHPVCIKRLVGDFAPETIMAVFKNHYGNLEFSIQATYALSTLIVDEDDETIFRIGNSGFFNYANQALRRNPDSEKLASWVFRTLYFLSCDNRCGIKLSNTNVFDTLAVALENHASYEPFAEWACRFLHQMHNYGEYVNSKMRISGMCEMITSAIQRQAISMTVSSLGCLVIGDLARDFANESRLTSSGACEAVVGALKRHITSLDVCYNACYAIHFLCLLSPNIVTWMGANGACEAVVDALNRHGSTCEQIAKYGTNAIGSLAYKSIGNLNKLIAANACKTIINVLTIHSESQDICEFSCRAISNLCKDNINVNEFGKLGACSLVVKVLQRHFNNTQVVSQALFAISGLAMKPKSEKVHKGNTKKLISEGVIQILVDVMQRYANEEHVQRASGMAITSLSFLPENRLLLGSYGACELVSNAIQLHISSAAVVSKLALAIDSLACDCEPNINKLTSLKAVENLTLGLRTHEKVNFLVADCLRALIRLCQVEKNSSKIFSQESNLKLFIRLLKFHEKDVKVALWGCHLIYLSTLISENKIFLCNLKVHDILSSILVRHYTDLYIVFWCCKSMVSLMKHEDNKKCFASYDVCNGLVLALLLSCGLNVNVDNSSISNQNNNNNNNNDIPQSLYVEVAHAAIESISLVSSIESTHKKFVSAGVGVAMAHLLHKHGKLHEEYSASEVEKQSFEIIKKYHPLILQFACDSIYNICKDRKAQKSFYDAGLVPILGDLLLYYQNYSEFCIYISRALVGLCSNHTKNATAICEFGLPFTLAEILQEHLLSEVCVEWSCALISTICQCRESSKVTKKRTFKSDKNSCLSNQLLFNQADIISILSRILYHYYSIKNSNLAVTILKSLRYLAVANPTLTHSLGINNIIIPLCLMFLTIEKLPIALYENAAWILSNVEYIGYEEEVVVPYTEDQLDLDFPTKKEEKKPEKEPEASVNYGTSLKPLHFNTPILDSNQLINLNSILLPASSFYNTPHHWDILLFILRRNLDKTSITRWVLLAIALFAEKGQLYHKNLVEFLASKLSHFRTDETNLSKMYLAIGALSFHHFEHRLIFGRLRVCEEVELAFKQFPKVGAITYGILPAIIGLSWNCEANQTRFFSLPYVLSSLMKLLYQEIENAWICKASALACISLMNGNNRNQSRFSPIAGFVTDIISCHKGENIGPENAINFLHSFDQTDLEVDFKELTSNISKTKFSIIEENLTNIKIQTHKFVPPQLSTSNTSKTTESHPNSPIDLSRPIIRKDSRYILPDPNSINVTPGYGTASNEEPWKWLRIGHPVFTLVNEAVDSSGCLKKESTKSFLTPFLSNASSSNLLVSSHSGSGLSRTGAQLISSLCHMNIINRNKLGANEVCSSLVSSLHSKLEIELRLSWKNPTHTFIYWALKALGDLAANHPHNQYRLGQAGICELIFDILKHRPSIRSRRNLSKNPSYYNSSPRASFSTATIAASGSASTSFTGAPKTSTSPRAITAAVRRKSMTSMCPITVKEDKDEIDGEAKMFAILFWVIGNIIQLDRNNGYSGSATSNTETQADSQADKPKKMVGFGNTPIEENENKSQKNNIEKFFSNLSSSFLSLFTGTTSSSSNTFSVLSASKSKKNRTKLLELGAIPLLFRRLKEYQYYPVVQIWGARALFKLAKEKKILFDLVELGALDYINGIVEQYSHTKGENYVKEENDQVLYWSKKLKELLESNTKGN